MTRDEIERRLRATGSDLPKVVAEVEAMLREVTAPIAGALADAIAQRDTAQQALLDNTGPSRPGERIPLHYFAEYQRAKADVATAYRRGQERMRERMRHLLAITHWGEYVAALPIEDEPK